MANQPAESSTLRAEAEEHERKCEWKEAARCYDKLFEEGSLESLESVRITLRLADLHWRVAGQTDDAQSFRAEVEAIRSTYRRLEQQFEKDSSSLPHRIAKARRIHFESFLVQEARQRRRLLDEAILINRTALVDWEPQQGRVPWWLAGCHLWMLQDRRAVDDGEVTAALLTEAIALGERLLSSCDGYTSDELAELYCTISCDLWEASRFFDEWAKNPGRRVAILEKAMNLLPHVRSELSRFFLNSTIAGTSFFLEG